MQSIEYFTSRFFGFWLGSQEIFNSRGAGLEFPFLDAALIFLVDIIVTWVKCVSRALINSIWFSDKCTYSKIRLTFFRMSNTLFLFWCRSARKHLASLHSRMTGSLSIAYDFLTSPPFYVLLKKQKEFLPQVVYPLRAVSTVHVL